MLRFWVYFFVVANLVCPQARADRKICGRQLLFDFTDEYVEPTGSLAPIREITENLYRVRDPVYPSLLYVLGELDERGTLSMAYTTVLKDGRRSVLRASELYKEIVRHFGDRAKTIKEVWTCTSEEDMPPDPNLETFNRGAASGELSEEMAASGTWAGALAVSLGFTSVVVDSRDGTPGACDWVDAYFSKPSSGGGTANTLFFD